MTSKERIYAALGGEPRDRVPVTPIIMAWGAHFVGRTYRDYYLDGEVLVEAQLAVARAFELDQVSAISDPWREARGYGMEFDYPEEGVGVPRGHLLRSPDDLALLGPLDIEACERMSQRVHSVRRLAEEVGDTHSVLGWAEGPLAEYCDLRGMNESMMDLVDQPDLFHQAAEILVDNGIAFARAQVRAGADMIGVGDAAASLIGPALYREHVLSWERKLVDGIHAAGAAVKLHICGNVTDIIADLAATGADIVDVDWMVPLSHARRAVGDEVALAGNFDPTSALLRATPDAVGDAARGCLADAGDRFLLQPGCEVPPGTPEANLRAFCPGPGCRIADALRT